MARILDEANIRILKVLDAGFLSMNDLLDFALSGGINYSHRLSGKAFKDFKRRSWQRRVALNTENQEAAERKKFCNLIYRLRAQGLITKDEKGMQATISITQKGTEKFRALSKRPTKEKNLSYTHGTSTHYKKKKISSSIIVSFDIPEKEKGKRDWLRSVLRNLDYKILHESVWIGTTALPKDFLDDCKRMHMTKYIHIFSVINKGTLGD